MVTKPDKTRHLTRELSVEQRNAIDLLVTGKTDAETAAVVGVSRQTICGWRNHHPAFMAEMNARRQAIWGTAGDRLRALMPMALDTLEAALTADPPDWRAASKVIQLAGLDRDHNAKPTLGPASIGPTDVDDVLDDHVRRRRGNPLQDIIDGPVTESERQAVLQEMNAKLGD